MGAPGPPDIVGASSEIIGFRNRGAGPVGHPQGVQVKPRILNIKCLPKGHRECDIKRELYGLAADTRSAAQQGPAQSMGFEVF
jgi:hypothetical protein